MMLEGSNVSILLKPTHTHRAGAAGPNSRMRRNQWTQSQRQPGFGTYHGTSPATSPVQQFCQSRDVAVTVSVEVS